MFHQARLRLTLLYTFIILALFYTFSAGVYLWMNHCFGDGAKKDRPRHEYAYQQNLFPNDSPTDTPGDNVMDELRNVLLISDVILLVGIPFLVWVLTGKTLIPVQQAHEREKQFLTDASHDLRTPLTILRADMELSLRKERSREVYKQSLQENKKEVEKLISLVEHMLLLTREQTQTDVHLQEQVDLVDLIANQVVMLQKTAKEKKIHLTYIPPDESSVILGNEQLLQRLFMGLIDNAMKYTPAKGSITISIHHTLAAIVVKIRDTGIGIPKEQQEKIFDRFYRADTSRATKGYGLGLSIAKEIVALHKGTIWLESLPRKGTTFFISFPLS